MRFTTSSLVLLELASAVLAVPSQTASAAAKRPRQDATKAKAVRRAFEVSWEGYLQHAFPHDTLKPVSNGFEDDRNGWGVTVVDALTTAIVMGETDIINQMLDHIARIDFNTTAQPDDRISLFETNIRYLGGLVSGYDLLKGPMSNLKISSRKVETLLRQAESLADTLSIAFDTPSGVPDSAIFLNPTKRISGANENSIAEVGTLVLEWTRLSDQTRNPKYAKLVAKAESHLLRPRGSPEPWPGLVGTTVSTKDGEFLDSNGGWSGGTDSFYEYLIKMYQYDPKSFGEYKERWVLAADSTMKHLASHPTGHKNLTYLSQFSGKTLDPVSTHLASFAGGSFILGGVVLDEPKYKQFGLELTESYFHNYLETPAGIGPEVFRWVDADLPKRDNNGPPPDSQRKFYEKAAFYSTAGSYILRPETLESVYYAYRLTGDSRWQDMAWQAFESIKKTCRTGSAFGELHDVMEADGGGFFDQMQSFWMAETLKYLYLIFAEDSDVQLQLQGGDRSKFVFNTEAHPVRIRA